MNTPPASRDEKVFWAAVALPAEERPAFLDAECGDDHGLRQRVEELLASHEATEFMAGLAAPLSREIEEQFERLKPEEAGERIGNYKLIEQIGEGGFGTVWLAEQQQPVQRQVALKIIKLGMDTREVIARFEQERQALAVMDHPNIAKVFDAGATKFGRPYFVMELVRGTRITDYCDEALMPARERLQLFIAVCHAVQHAHQKGIIHRDLKPSNILVTQQDGVPVPKVIDFGVAKAIHGRLAEATITTNLEEMIGTPLYMSPEQAELRIMDVDTRSDIYSLGVLLYELLTGSTPFTREDLARAGYAEMRRLICEAEPKKPSTALQTMAPQTVTAVARCRQCEPSKLIHILRGDLDWIVMKAIEKERARRYETVNGLARDIQRFLTDEPVSAMPPSRGYRFRKFVRRNKLGLSAAAAVAALVIGIGVIGFLWNADRATRAESEQNRLRDRIEFNRQVAAADARATKSTAEAQMVKHFRHATAMNAAQEALRSNNVGLARQFLDAHRPAPGEPDLRGWDWRYLWQESLSGPRAMLTKHEGFPVFSASFSPDNASLLLGYSDGVVELWNVAAREKQLVQSSFGQQAHAVFSPDGESFAATMGAGVVNIVNAKTGAKSRACTVGGSVRELSYSKDGQLLAVLCRDVEHVVIVRTADCVVVMDYPLPSRGGRFFNNVRISPDNDRIYVSCGSFQKPTVQCVSVPGKLLLWEIPIGLIDESEPENGTDAGFSAMDLSPDGHTLVVATGYRDSKIRVLDVEKGRLVKTLVGHNKYVLQVAFSKDGRILVSSSEDTTVRLWNTATWTKLTAPLLGHNSEVNAVAISGEGRFIASGSKDGEVLLWDTRVPQPARGGRDLPSDIRRVFPLPVSRMVVGQRSDGKWFLIDLLTLAKEPLPASEISPDGQFPRFVQARYRRQPRRLDPGALGLRGPLRDSAVSPDGKLLVVGSESGEIGFYDAATRSKIEVVRSNLGSVFGVAFSPNEQCLVLSSGGDSGVAVWDVAIRHELITLSTNSSLLAEVAFTDDGSTILTGPAPTGGSSKGPIHFWRAPSLQEIDDAECIGGRWPQNEASEPPPLLPDVAQLKILLETEYRERLSGARAQLPEELNRRDETLEDFVDLLDQQHRYAETVPLRREFLERLKQRGPQDNTALFAATEKLLSAILSRMQSERETSDAGLLDNLTKQADALVSDLLAILTRISDAVPADTNLSLAVALGQIWFGRQPEHAALCRRLFERAEKDRKNADAMERAAAAWCSNPSGDPALRARALELARDAEAIAGSTWENAWRQKTLGLANYRAGNDKEAEQMLVRAAETAEQFRGADHPFKRPLQSSVLFIRSMIRFRAGDVEEGRRLFAEGKPGMKELPADHRQVFKVRDILDLDDVMVWLAYKEAEVMWKASGSSASKKP